MLEAAATAGPSTPSDTAPAACATPELGVLSAWAKRTDHALSSVGGLAGNPVDVLGTATETKGIIIWCVMCCTKFSVPSGQKQMNPLKSFIRHCRTNATHASLRADRFNQTDAVLPSRPAAVTSGSLTPPPQTVVTRSSSDDSARSTKQSASNHPRKVVSGTFRVSQVLEPCPAGQTFDEISDLHPTKFTRAPGSRWATCSLCQGIVDLLAKNAIYNAGCHLSSASCQRAAASKRNTRALTSFFSTHQVYVNVLMPCARR